MRWVSGRRRIAELAGRLCGFWRAIGWRDVRCNAQLVAQPRSSQHSDKSAAPQNSTSKPARMSAQRAAPVDIRRKPVHGAAGASGVVAIARAHEGRKVQTWASLRQVHGCIGHETVTHSLHDDRVPAAGSDPTATPRALWDHPSLQRPVRQADPRRRRTPSPQLSSNSERQTRLPEAFLFLYFSTGTKLT